MQKRGASVRKTRGQLANVWYRDIDPALKLKFPIDDVWDESAKVPTSNAFRFIRNGTRLMLMIDKEKDKPISRMSCIDMRVGCVMFKMYQQTGSFEFTEHEFFSTGSNSNTTLPLPNKSRDPCLDHPLLRDISEFSDSHLEAHGDFNRAFRLYSRSLAHRRACIQRESIYSATPFFCRSPSISVVRSRIFAATVSKH